MSTTTDIEIPDFEAPDWLSETAAEINARMMENLPDGIDKTEAGFAWDLTMPTALEKAEYMQYQLTLALQMMFSLWAVGSWLDGHAVENGLSRKEASYAEGTVTVTGTAGTVIPEGFEFATEATGDTESKIYKATEAVTLDDDGYGEVPVTAETAGADGNTPAGTVVLMVSSLNGIESITNEDVITGGADEETDDELRQRVVYAERNGSYTGCDSDYVRWALEVSGVGAAKCIPLWNGRGSVKVLIEDADGNAANPELIEKVYNYIVSPDDASARLAPIGANVTVASVQFFDVNITYDYLAMPNAMDEESIAAVQEEFTAAATEYINTTARETLRISYNKLYAMLAGLDGVLSVVTFIISFKFDDEDTRTLEQGEIYRILDKGIYPQTGTITMGGTFYVS